MVRIRLGTGWREDPSLRLALARGGAEAAEAARRAADAISIEVDGVDVAAGRAEAALFPALAALADGVARLAGGATLTLELTWGLLMEKDFAYLNVFGSGGAALLNPFRIHKGMHGSLVNVTPATLDSPAHQYKTSIEGQIAHLADVLRKGARPMGLAEEIVPVMALMDAIYRSAEQGREVRLD